MEIQSETRSFKHDAVRVMFVTAEEHMFIFMMYIYSLGRVTQTGKICMGGSRKCEQCSITFFFFFFSLQWLIVLCIPTGPFRILSKLRTLAFSFFKQRRA